MNYDPLDTCPYDPVHRILRSRMQFHLTRCSKNFPCSKKKQCPFDARHIINQMEYNYHIATCPGRESVWHYKIYDKDSETLQKLVPIDQKPALTTSENWDNDIDVASYNPLQHVLERPVVRTIIGACKSERKKFMQNERLRISQLDEGSRKRESQAETVAKTGNKPTKNSGKMKSNYKQPNSDNAEQDQEYKPLRRPKKFQSDNSNTPINSSINDVSINDSIEKDNKKSTTQTSTVQHVQEISNEAQSNKVPTEKNSIETKNNNPAPKTVPFNYVSPLNKTLIKCTPVIAVIEEDEDENEDVVIEGVIDDVEDTQNADTSIIEKLSKTVEEIVIGDEGHKQKSESLNKKLELLKKAQMEKNSNSDKKMSRIAANFPSLK